jgi:hypothetical protein
MMPGRVARQGAPLLREPGPESTTGVWPKQLQEAPGLLKNAYFATESS